MRSVVVVFPASMCAMMPMFLQRSNGTVLGTTLLLPSGLQLFGFDHGAIARFSDSDHSVTRSRNRLNFLPPVMRERLVRFRHAVDVLFFLDGGSTAVRRVQQLIAQLVNNALFTAGTSVSDNP